MFVILFIPAFIVLIQFIYYLLIREELSNWLIINEVITLIVYPILFLSVMDTYSGNKCCTANEMFFAPENRVTAYSFIALSVIFFILSRISFYRKLPPLLELVTVTGLFAAFVFTILINIHLNDYWILLGGLGVSLLFFIRILEHFKQLSEKYKKETFEISNTAHNKLAINILTADCFIKYPIILLLCFPLILLCISILMLFGQKPDSVLTMFTQTYSYGFSQLECVQCSDSHFLCTIAAKGHPFLVKPLREGYRKEKAILVNRQLLVSNAFEEKIYELSPILHSVLRGIYNFIGRRATNLNNRLGNAYLSDIIYLLMKPFEWLFILFLYLTDTEPEIRILRQYINGNNLPEAKI